MATVSISTPSLRKIPFVLIVSNTWAAKVSEKRD
jgi:hypothetical protein